MERAPLLIAAPPDRLRARTAPSQRRMLDMAERRREDLGDKQFDRKASSVREPGRLPD